MGTLSPNPWDLSLWPIPASVPSRRAAGIAAHAGLESHRARDCGRDDHRQSPPAQIRTSGITAYGSSLGFERRSEHQDKDEEFAVEVSIDQRSASVVPNRVSAADSGDVVRVASNGRSVLGIAKAWIGSPARRDNESIRPPPASATLRPAPLARASSGATPALWRGVLPSSALTQYAARPQSDPSSSCHNSA